MQLSVQPSATKHVCICIQSTGLKKEKFSVLFLSGGFFCWSSGAALSHHPLQDVEDADAVDGDEGGEVRRDVDPLQRTSRRIEGLQGLAFLHIPPLDKRQRKKEKEAAEFLFKQETLLQSTWEEK